MKFSLRFKNNKMELKINNAVNLQGAYHIL